MRGQPWTGAELARLMRMKAAGAKWAEVAAALPGRTATAIMQTHYKVANNRRRAEARAYAHAMGAQRKQAAANCAAPPPPAAVPVPAPRLLPEPNGRFMPTSRLVAEAEIRDRIAELGLTAGWFGDPAPGRSALDKKRAGEPV